MKIITGTARGCSLVTLEGEETTRPTLQRAKETVFSSIQFEIEGRAVLDLFAGSGQMGLEALSRGASNAVFCDASEQAAEIVRQNALKTKLYSKCKIMRLDYKEYIRAASNSKRKFGIVFLDPPYNADILSDALVRIHKADLLEDEAIVLCETENAKFLEENPDVLSLYEEVKMYKCGRIYYFRLKKR